MRNLTTLTLALAAGVVAIPAVADSNLTPISPSAIKSHQAAVAADALERNKRVRAAAPAQGGGVATEKALAKAGDARPGTPHANGFRTYPPSCAADPLPSSVSGPVLAQARVPLLAKDAYTLDPVGVEDVTLTVWRLACSSSGELTPYNGDGGANSLTLVSFARDTNASPDTLVTFPLLKASQSGSDFDDASRVRPASEPNTVISDTAFDSPMPDVVTYSLENYPYVGYRSFFFNYPFVLRVDPGLSNVNPVDVPVEGYEPIQSEYPDAFNTLPFDGYAAAQWVGKTRPDDGLLVQISEQWTGTGADATYSRQLVFDLLTKDQNGNAIWLVGNAPFNEGGRSITMDAFYISGPRPFPHWGKVTFTFPHCSRLDMSFTPDGGLPASAPVINGSAEYSRLFSANGMMCE
ncbi:hypothetical protein [Dokdonella ginsengisoli]|uniref:Uncharacterized protein n=1 Tax=Dokdonella ginsengisoli TaxID=363846 RepID=A0ABV9QNG6_9GAMM